MEYRGLFRLKGCPDLPVVRFAILMEDQGLVAYVWTDDGQLDKVARAPDHTSESYQRLDGVIRETAIQWLLAQPVPKS